MLNRISYSYKDSFLWQEEKKLRLQGMRGSQHVWIENPPPHFSVIEHRLWGSSLESNMTIRKEGREIVGETESGRESCTWSCCIKVAHATGRGGNYFVDVSRDAGGPKAMYSYNHDCKERTFTSPFTGGAKRARKRGTVNQVGQFRSRSFSFSCCWINPLTFFLATFWHCRLRQLWHFSSLPYSTSERWRKELRIGGTFVRTHAG